MNSIKNVTNWSGTTDITLLDAYNRFTGIGPTGVRCGSANAILKTVEQLYNLANKVYTATTSTSDAKTVALAIMTAITATSGRFDNCTIGNSCTIGGQRVDGAFVKNANIASGAVTGGKIATGAVTASKISAGAVTADKLNVSTLSAITADLGTVTAGTLDITQGLKINGSSTITDGLTICSLESAGCTMSGNPQALGGSAITYFSISLGISTVKLYFNQGILTSGTKTSGTVKLLDYTFNG